MPDEKFNPLVTVITVTYNSSAFVRDAIESVLAQTYTHIQYIIGDDCSTDNTWEIIQEYNDPRILAYRNHANLKEYPNRNKALEMAEGEYIIFIDGDDIIFKHGVKFFTEEMEMFPEAAMAVQKNYYNNILYPALFFPEETYRNYFFGKIGLLTSSLTSNFFRASSLKKLGFFKTTFITGDEEIRLRLAAEFPIIYVAGWVSWPRETPGQASSKIPPGIGLSEIKKMVTGIFKDSKTTLPLSLQEDILQSLNHKLAKTALRLLIKGKIRAIINEGAFLDCHKKEFLTLCFYKARHNDPLLSFTSVNPYKKGYLRTKRD